MLQINREGCHYVVSTPYDPGLVEAIKTELPRRRWRWCRQRRAWLIDWRAWALAEHGLLEGVFSPSAGHTLCTRRQRQRVRAAR
jgi:hypothetical protein